MEGEDKHFASVQEEMEYWKSMSQKYKESLEDTREELEEFQISSRELEAELEAQLEQQESKNKELHTSQQRLQREVEGLREKLEAEQAKCHRQTTEMADELAQVRAYKEELAKYIRELEQSNDDLERAKRATVVSLEDFEGRLNQAIERNAFLESELEERETLLITVQRLKDEARDLRQELAVKKPGDTTDEESDSAAKSPGREERITPGGGDKVDSLVQTDHIDSNKLMEELITPNHTPQGKLLSNHQTNGGTPLTPSARISALNIVGDLLRKVGALESKLASCRNVVNNQPRGPKSGANSPLNSPRAKRLHRGTAVGGSGGSMSASSSASSSLGAALGGGAGPATTPGSTHSAPGGAAAGATTGPNFGGVKITV